MQIQPPILTEEKIHRRSYARDAIEARRGCISCRTKRLFGGLLCTIYDRCKPKRLNSSRLSHIEPYVIMQRSKLSRTLATSRSFSKKGLDSDVVKRRLKEGCVIPSITAVSKTAVRALEDRVSAFLPQCLTGAKRSEILASVPCNGVPESLIVECVISDSTGMYVHHYSNAARRNLRDAKVSRTRLASSVALDSYYGYLSEVSGASINCNNDKIKNIDRKQRVTALLYFSTYGKSALTKKPFKGSGVNAAYKTIRRDLATAADSVQKYGYYMRPDDPMNRSEDTATRLECLLSYVATLYRCCMHFMDTIDAKVLEALGRAPSVLGPRERKTPDILLAKYARMGFGAGSAAALTRLTHDSVMAFMKVCTLCSTASWRSKDKGLERAILAAVDAVTFVHHHCQYIINLVLAGYACWLRGGISDKSLLYATKQQGRFCHFLGQLAPTATSHSWSAMETGTEMWFNFAIAGSMLRYGGPTPHYLLTTDTFRRDLAGPATGRQRPLSCAVNGAHSDAWRGQTFSGLFGGKPESRDGDAGEPLNKCVLSDGDRRRPLYRCEKINDLSSLGDSESYVTVGNSEKLEKSSRSSSGSYSLWSTLEVSDDDGDDYWYSNPCSRFCNEESCVEDSFSSYYNCDGSEDESECDEMYSSDDDEEGAGGDREEDDEPIYVSMEEIEACRSRQLAEEAKASEPTDKSCGTYDVPQARGIGTEEGHYLVPTACRQRYKIIKDLGYDVPSAILLCRRLTLKSRDGSYVIYDVPRPNSS